MREKLEHVNHVEFANFTRLAAQQNSCVWVCILTVSLVELMRSDHCSHMSTVLFESLIMGQLRVQSMLAIKRMDLIADFLSHE